MPRPRFSTAIATAVFFSAPRPGLPGATPPMKLSSTSELDLDLDLELAGEPVPARAHHRPPELVQPRPRGLVGAERERPLQAERAHAALLVRDVPSGSEPERQRRAGAGEDRARGR
jgi:hypothetical protein